MTHFFISYKKYLSLGQESIKYFIPVCVGSIPDELKKLSPVSDPLRFELKTETDSNPSSQAGIILQQRVLQTKNHAQGSLNGTHAKSGRRWNHGTGPRRMEQVRDLENRAPSSRNRNYGTGLRRRNRARINSPERRGWMVSLTASSAFWSHNAADVYASYDSYTRFLGFEMESFQLLRRKHSGVQGRKNLVFRIETIWCQG